jgi:hypothetical protein
MFSFRMCLATTETDDRFTVLVQYVDLHAFKVGSFTVCELYPIDCIVWIHRFDK